MHELFEHEALGLCISSGLGFIKIKTTGPLKGHKTLSEAYVLASSGNLFSRFPPEGLSLVCAWPNHFQFRELGQDLSSISLFSVFML